MTVDTDGPTITTDIVIVGSGMGGGTLAYALRNRGAKILIVERGDYLRGSRKLEPAGLFFAKRYHHRSFPWYGKPFSLDLLPSGAAPRSTALPCRASGARTSGS